MNELMPTMQSMTVTDPAVENYKDAKELSEQAQEILEGHKEKLIKKQKKEK
jgi:hypothetical protein